MRPYVIVNPRAGGGLAGRTARSLEAVLARRLGPVDVVLSERPGHAVALAQEATAAGREMVIGVGGDGTFHEVANGVLAGGGRATMGYVGQGTGGDFRRTLGIEHRLDRYVDAIASGRDRLIDVGKMHYRGCDGAPQERWFVNILSAGMGGLVDRHVAQTSKVFGGKAAYLWASVRALADCQRGRLRCTWSLGDRPSTDSFDAYMIAVCNGRYFGSGMHVAPMANPSDGHFDVVVMDAPSKLAFATFSRQIFAGHHLRTPGVSHFACDRLHLDLEHESARDVFLLDADGEAVGSLPIEIQLVPRALRIRVPESTPSATQPGGAHV